MNINRKTRLPPSPSSYVCRKPLLNITNLPSAEIAKEEKLQLKRPQSTKNMRPRISIEQLAKPKLKQVHSRKSSLESKSSYCIQRCCKNHKNRTAMHKIDFQMVQFFCFECSLIYAKQGYKIKAINASNDVERLNRQRQANQYLQKCNSTQGEIINWRKQQNKTIKQIYQQFGQMIHDEKIMMEEQINKIKALHINNIKIIEENRELKISVFKETDSQIQKLSKNLQCTKIDIQSNYEDCIKNFDSKQFRIIMDQYWKQIKQVQNFIITNSVDTLVKKSGVDMKMTVKTMGRSENNMNEFTFSKQKAFETPPFNKQLRGIKFAQSHPDSNRYDSSLKQSVVDTKINFSDFNI